ncbi:MAG: ATP-binding cassette domain-containing protein [Lachnospiraceae bacterium]|jgi:cell division transport system ATP-binding protein|nr:ATP-binding cassette domain-containing protein [Lachnospiraceae bacterium]MCI9389289.1 ATP-binding cassette domain-containing protein [Lachnospiraceae bacterium]MCI9471618.1 ATP-binding cassette domain-containing protein [Lachnospiraceae bacterium]
MQIVFDHVTKKFQEGTIGLEKVSFEIQKGEFVFIIGESGAGKSTLLKLLTKRAEVTSGSIYVEDQAVRKLTRKKIPYFRRQFGIMDKEAGLLEYMDLYQNVELALIATEQPEAVRRTRVMKALKLMGLSGKEDHLPIEVSIGERARAMLARAIVTNPSILVLDEPTANLDPGLAWDIMSLVDKINRAGVTVLMVSHSKDLVNVMHKRVLTLVAGALVSDEKRGRYDPRAMDIFAYRKVMRKRYGNSYDVRENVDRKSFLGSG